MSAEKAIEPLELEPVIQPVLLYPYLKVCDICAYIQYSERTVYDLLETKKIRATKTPSGQWRARVEDVDKYMAENIYEPDCR